MESFTAPTIIHADNQITTAWSGGTTTELFIFPNGSEFAKRNFDFRLSTATVETESSRFTSLVDFNRVLMVLDGQMDLSHKNHHQSSLGKFDLDRFKGVWQTDSIGRCTDFNLIYRNDLQVEMKGHSLVKNEFVQLTMKQDNWFFIYCISGGMNVLIKQKDYLLYPHSLLVFKSDETHLVELFADLDVEFIELSFE